MRNDPNPVSDTPLPVAEQHPGRVDWIDRTVYRLKINVPWLARLALLPARACTILLYRRAISRARTLARIEGTVAGQPAVMRCLVRQDLDQLNGMIQSMPAEHLRFFHPHALDPRSLSYVIARQDIMTYGLFVEGRMCAYAILKLFPTRKAYLGRLVRPEMTNMGIGRFLSRFLYWQASVLGFQPCSTIHAKNVASLSSHAAVRPFTVAATLPNGYRLIRFTLLPEDATPPKLCLALSAGSSGQRAPHPQSDTRTDP